MSKKNVIEREINGFRFEVDEGQLEHIARHLAGSEVAGSHFKKNAFTSVKALVDYALNHLQDYNGKRTEREINAGRIIGFDALKHKEDLPEGVNLYREPRGNFGYMTNVVCGVPKEETRQIVAVAGPKGEEKHGFYTIFPGKNAPPLPVGEEKLKEWGYSGDKLEEAAEKNKQYGQFWDQHVLIKGVGYEIQEIENEFKNNLRDLRNKMRKSATRNIPEYNDGLSFNSYKINKCEELMPQYTTRINNISDLFKNILPENSTDLERITALQQEMKYRETTHKSDSVLYLSNDPHKGIRAVFLEKTYKKIDNLVDDLTKRYA